MTDRIDLEGKQEFKKKLSEYIYIDHNADIVDILKIGYFVRYIRINPDTDAHIVLGGRIDEILIDKKNPTLIYRIKIKTNTGNVFMVKLKGNTNIYLYYKIQMAKEMQQEKVAEWKSRLSGYEKQRFDRMKINYAHETNNSKKGKIKKDFYEWLYRRRPDLKPM